MAATAQQILDAVNDWLLENFANREGVFSYTVNGRTVTVHGLEQVKSLRRELESEVARGSGRSETLVRFSR